MSGVYNFCQGEALAKQTGDTVGGRFPPPWQGTAVTRLSLTISHRQPCHFNPTLNAAPQAAARSRRKELAGSGEGLGGYIRLPASVRFSFGEWTKSGDAHWPAKWGGQVTIAALHK